MLSCVRGRLESGSEPVGPRSCHDRYLPTTAEDQNPSILRDLPRERIIAQSVSLLLCHPGTLVEQPLYEGSRASCFAYGAEGRDAILDMLKRP